jgi:hypothetical protein
MPLKYTRKTLRQGVPISGSPFLKEKQSKNRNCLIIVRVGVGGVEDGLPHYFKAIRVVYNKRKPPLWHFLANLNSIHDLPYFVNRDASRPNVTIGVSLPQDQMLP